MMNAKNKTVKIEKGLIVSCHNATFTDIIKAIIKHLFNND